MPTFQPLICSVRDGDTIGKTVDAINANEAVRHVATATCVYVELHINR